MFSSQNSQVSSAANYIEDVFSTYLYTGNGSTQTITNGIDLSTKGGLVWIKDRAISSAQGLFDTVSGATKYVQAQSSTSQNTDSTTLTSFNSNGFSLGSNGNFNSSSSSIAAWTFRQQAKFFTVVSWTGNGANRAINHDLGSVPGCILIKCKSNVGTNWAVYHRSIANTEYLTLNTTDAKATNTTYWNSTTPTNTQFSLGTSSLVNANGFTYVAYLFAHDAGGFGLTGTDNVISCGSYTHNSTSGVDVNLGYEPQWILQKNAGAASGWLLIDNMRGWVVDANDQYLTANSSGVEDNIVNSSPTATGFKVDAGAWGNGANIIYIAIRRGPMKVPTSGTSVFSPNATSGTTDTKITTNFPLDLNIVRDRTASTGFQSGFAWSDRLRELSSTTSATTTALQSTNTNAETTGIWGLNKFVDNIGFKIAADYSGLSQIYYSFRRAPSFMDVVCYTGDAVAGRTVAHNLGVAPELVIAKRRSASSNWRVLSTALSQAGALESTAAFTTTGLETYYGNDVSYVAPTSSVFTVGSNAGTNGNGHTHVAYLFATCAGVSKVGSYTGNGSSQTINCGFTSGARFVLIKRTDSTGDWYVWDSARGIVAGNDPYLLLNSTAAEVTSTDYIDTYSAGFEISSTAPAAINASGGTFIFLAIA